MSSPDQEMKLKKPSLDVVRPAGSPIDQKGELADPGPGRQTRLRLPREAPHTHDQAALARLHAAIRAHDHVLAADVDVVHEPSVGHVQAVAGGCVARALPALRTRPPANEHAPRSSSSGFAHQARSQSARARRPHAERSACAVRGTASHSR